MDPLGALKQLSATELRFLIALLEDPLAELQNERPPQQLSATELRSHIALYEDAARACRAEIALLEDAARACRAEPESHTARLDALPDDIQQLIFGQLCNALDPRTAVDFISASNGLWKPMKLYEGASKSPLEQLQEENAAAAALCHKMGMSCKELREAKWICWPGPPDPLWSLTSERNKGLSTTDLATLGKLIPVLPALERLCLAKWTIEWGPDSDSDSDSDSESGSAGPDGGQLVEGLGVGALPAVTYFELVNVCVGDAGASALAAALDRGALPRLEYLALPGAAIGDAGLLALAPALRRRPALERLYLENNPFGDEGLAALVAPSPADAPQAEVLAQLKWLDLNNSQITDDGCAQLASWLRNGALPALDDLSLFNISASNAAVRAVYKARPGLDCRDPRITY